MTNYTFQTVVVPDATDGTWLGGINNSGEVAGYDAGFGFDHYPKPFTYSDGTFTPLANFSEASRAHANGINNAGQVVGEFGFGTQATLAYLWSPNAPEQTISSVTNPGSNAIDKAYGVNDAGQVVGVDLPFGEKGFVWQNGSFSFLKVPGASATEAHGINNAGTIVGTADSHGFLDANGQFSTIDVSGATATDPMAINTSGTIAGSYNDGAHWHGFIDTGGQMSFINEPDASDTWVTGLNDKGQLTGYFQPSAGGPVQGFIATPQQAPADPPPLSVFDTSTQSQVTAAGTPYSGPVAGLQNQYINTSSDSLNVTATTPGWFIHTGSGTDAISTSSGTNVLDGGTGSNFLTGGTGTDTFFVDDRAASSDIWSTVVGFHQGDSATIWGVTPQDFSLDWVDGQGAAGYTGLTLHETKPSAPTASLTLAGYSQADIASGRLTVQFGTDTASGSSYMYIHT
jgi:probable HAF family extracellular repeat protein